ncbi:MAG: ROK family protein [Peptococcaceae bacterium]|nr:ROK family protein [Peptococcaceae bacterium]
MERYVVGVDLGGTKIYTALADLRGRILAEARVPTGAAGGPEAVMERIAETVRRVLGEVGGAAPAAVGIGSPGMPDPATGAVYSSPNLGWDGVPLKKRMEEILGAPVLVDNDANLAALGEYSFGAGQGARHMAYVTVSTGIGGGLILDGRIYRGAGGGAGEIGHMVLDPDGPLCGCGRRGCLEALASGTAMAARARELVAAGRGKAILGEAGDRAGDITAVSVARAAAAGDAEAREIIFRAGECLGMGLANLINLVNPDRLVIGGGALGAGEPLWAGMERELSARALRPALDRVRVVMASLNGRSGLIGAVALAVNRELGSGNSF